jgi:RNA polymerase-binding transcription factor DksA
MTTIEDRKTQLETRREELVQRLRQVEAEFAAHTSRDWEEQATENEDDEVLEGLGAAAEAEIARIDAALERIGAGEYGFCMKCGAEISAARLDVLPYTPFCVDCAR